MKKFIVDTAERGARTFGQFYLGFWLLSAGLLGTGADANADAFDLLFTWDNVKAGVVGLALSVATAIGAKPFGDKDSASVLSPTSSGQ